MSVDPVVALDFLNTSAPPGGGTDLWAAPDAVQVWLTEAGLTTDPAALSRLPPPEARRLLDDALRLRRALGELLEAWTAHPPAALAPGLAMLELNRLLDAGPRRVPALAVGPWGYAIHHEVGAASVSGLLAGVAEAGALLLAHEDPKRVRRCAAPACARWFLDTSRNQRRRWCSMAVCGNRAKVAAHHRRSRRERD